MSGIGAAISAGIKAGLAAAAKVGTKVGAAGARVSAKVPQPVKTALGVGGEIAPDAASAGMNIQQAPLTSMTEGERAYQVTGEIIGAALNIGVGVVTTGVSIGGTVGATLTGGAALGPVGLAIAVVIAVVQILGAIIDQYVNPFQPMFNRNLNEMRAAYHSSIKNNFLEMGLNWPLEIKPDIINIVFGDEKNKKKYYDYLNEYYSNKNLISKQEFLEEYQLLLNIRKLVRNTRKYIFDAEGNAIAKQDTNQATFDIIAEGQSNLLLMLALQARIAKYRRENKPKPSMIKKFVEAYYVGMIFWSILLCLLIFLSIFFLFI